MQKTESVFAMDGTEGRSRSGRLGNRTERKLIVPIDTHMARIGRMLGATMRKTADMKMALEITETFKNWHLAIR